MVRSRTLVRQRVQDLSEFDFNRSEAWQDYLWQQVRTKRGFLCLELNDSAPDWEYRVGSNRPDAVKVKVVVPAPWFTGSSAEENIPVYRAIKERYFREFAERVSAALEN